MRRSSRRSRGRAACAATGSAATRTCSATRRTRSAKGKEKRLTYPWHNGWKGDQILEYYDTQTDHADWTHAESGAKVLKAQHPEFEMYNQGVHARSGVACADCHMPYKREGAVGGLLTEGRAGAARNLSVT